MYHVSDISCDYKTSFPFQVSADYPSHSLVSHESGTVDAMVSVNISSVVVTSTTCHLAWQNAARKISSSG